MTTNFDANDFRTAGHALVDYIADFLTHIDDRPVVPPTRPGDVRALLPEAAPEDPETWEEIMADLDRIIAPNLTQWQHPNFFAFFPANSSGPSILGDLVSSGLGAQGMMWATSPAATELETHVLDWMANACGLPERFLSSGAGGGVISDTASSATLVCLVAARARAAATHPGAELRAYCSSEAHSSVMKAAVISGVGRAAVRIVDTDNAQRMDPAHLRRLMEEDRLAGRVPVFVCATIGTTSTGAVDPVADIAAVANEFDAWVHVDAAYAGPASLCPEFRHLFVGLDFVDSFCFNPHKWMLTNFDCSLLWVADRAALTSALSVTPAYLQNPASASGEVFDYRDWQVPLGRRFRSLKLWFVLRRYGLSGIRDLIRGHTTMAANLAERVDAHPSLELFAQPVLGLVTMVHADGPEATEALSVAINQSREYLLTLTRVDEVPVLRVSIGAWLTEDRHVDALWAELDRLAHEIGAS